VLVQSELCVLCRCWMKPFAQLYNTGHFQEKLTDLEKECGVSSLKIHALYQFGLGRRHYNIGYTNEFMSTSLTNVKLIRYTHRIYYSVFCVMHRLDALPAFQHKFKIIICLLNSMALPLSQRLTNLVFNPIYLNLSQCYSSKSFSYHRLTIQRRLQSSQPFLVVSS